MSSNTSVDKMLLAVPGSSKLPALSPKWTIPINFCKYESLSDPLNSEEWLERVSFIADDLRCLLRLEHNVFWSQVLYDESLQKCLNSYLMQSWRYYDLISSNDDDCVKEVHRLVFMVFVRLSTHKESTSHFFTPEEFGNLIYENFVFDIPKIFDLCVLYGDGNKQLLSKMIGNVFKQQPLYYQDLKYTLDTMKQLLTKIAMELNINISDPDNEISSPVKLSSTNDVNLNIDLDGLMDIVLYILDIGVSLWSLLDIHPESGFYVLEAQFTLTLSKFSDVLFEYLDNVILFQIDIPDLLSRYNTAKSYFCKIVHFLIGDLCIKEAFENVERRAVWCRLYLDSITSIFDYPYMVKMLNDSFDLISDHEILNDIVEDVERMGFVRKSLENIAVNKKNLDNEHAPKQAGDVSDDKNVDKSCIDNFDVEIESLMYNIKDLLPDLGEGFILRCLEYYNNDSEQVVAAIFDGNLPEHIAIMDHNMARPSKTVHITQDVQELDKKTPQLGSTKGEFVIPGDDNDEYITVTTLYGKKPMHIDKPSDEDIKLVFEKLSLFDATESNWDRTGNIADNLYDDEYDDTYDSNTIGVIDSRADDMKNTVATSNCASSFPSEKTVYNGGKDYSNFCKAKQFASNTDQDRATEVRYQRGASSTGSNPNFGGPKRKNVNKFHENVQDVTDKTHVQSEAGEDNQQYGRVKSRWCRTFEPKERVCEEPQTENCRSSSPPHLNCNPIDAHGNKGRSGRSKNRSDRSIIYSNRREREIEELGRGNKEFSSYQAPQSGPETSKAKGRGPHSTKSMPHYQKDRRNRAAKKYSGMGFAEAEFNN